MNFASAASIAEDRSPTLLTMCGWNTCIRVRTRPADKGSGGTTATGVEDGSSPTGTRRLTRLPTPAGPKLFRRVGMSNHGANVRLPAHPAHQVDSSRRVRFYFNGRPVDAFSGDSVAT